jgi:voltage-gated potassium channel
MIDRKDLLKVLYLLLGVFATGIIGYSVIERWPPLDAFYMTVITISTVGFGEVQPLSDAGKIFSAFLIVAGVGVVFYAFTTFIQYYLRGQFQNIFGRRRMRKKITKLKDHFILCGYGTVGQAAVETCRSEGTPIVIVDRDKDAIEKTTSNGFLCIEGDATNYETLIDAGIERARGVIITTSDDATNVFIIVTVRHLAPELFIIARANFKDSVPKLEAAGANRVINPNYSAGQRMARFAVYPLVTDFIETVSQEPGEALEIDDIEIKIESTAVGKNIREAQSYSKGASILAIRKKGRNIKPKPPDNTKIEAGDRMIVLGTRDQLRLLEEEKKDV